MIESDDKDKYVRVIGTEGQMVTAEAIESSEPEDEYKPDNEGDLFLYQMTQALDGVEDILPKINFRRKHPQLGKKLANVEQRLRRIEGTIASFKRLLAPYLIEGYKSVVLNQIDEDTEYIIDSL